MISLLCAGGGTLGPVTPLLAVLETWRARGASLAVTWVGTSDGPEGEFVKPYVSQFLSLPKARLPRYLSLEWVTSGWMLMMAFFRALQTVRRVRPQLVCSAGGFSAVPVVWAARCLGVPVWVHQPDRDVLLSTRLTAPCARLLTCAWSTTQRHLKNAQVIGHPVRPSVLSGDKRHAYDRFSFTSDLPVVLVMGGGTGALAINEMVYTLLPWLSSRAQVIHLTGRGKTTGRPAREELTYRAFESLAGAAFADALACADIVVSRAGMGALSELAAAKKASIFLPLQGGQVANTNEVLQQEAGIILGVSASANDLQNALHHYLSDADERRRAAERLHRLFPAKSADQAIDLLRAHVLR